MALVHLDALYRGARRLTRRRAEAEDLVQETCVRAFQGFDRFAPGTNCRAWLFRIMRNAFLNRVRGERETPQAEEFYERYEVEHAGRGGHAGPEEALTRTVLHDDVDRALETLPERFREVVVLCDIEGFTYKEIADALDCPIGTVMSRVSRGRRRLRLALDGFSGGPGGWQRLRSKGEDGLPRAVRVR